ncbi:MAG: hypothetical protein Q8N79_09780 [Candidatus Methanoperedens sp.]|nr:hypothetical protein [Candidatus Methanoperedens sp.]
MLASILIINKIRASLLLHQENGKRAYPRSAPAAAILNTGEPEGAPV